PPANGLDLPRILAAPEERRGVQHKCHTRYLVDFDLGALAAQVRALAKACGVARVEGLIAVTDGGNGLEEAFQRHLADNLFTILASYHPTDPIPTFPALPP